MSKRREAVNISTLNRRAVLAKLGLAMAVAYAAPVALNLSEASAAGGGGGGSGVGTPGPPPTQTTGNPFTGSTTPVGPDLTESEEASLIARGWQ